MYGPSAAGTASGVWEAQADPKARTTMLPTCDRAVRHRVLRVETAAERSTELGLLLPPKHTVLSVRPNDPGLNRG